MGETGSIKPRIFKGTRDFLPETMIRREWIIEKVKTIFRRYGFEPMETPSVEYLDILLGKYGEEGDKLIYPLAYKGGKELALRYDLTVPLSRVIAMYPQMTKPFKRYQIQPVWRADQPQLVRGRYREFYQCDVDIVGASSILADAEIIALTNDILQSLGFHNFVIRINSRKILASLIEMAGLPSAMEETVCRSLDKLEKIGEAGVRSELQEKGIIPSTIDALLELLHIAGAYDEIISQLANHPRFSKSMEAALSEIEELLGYLSRYEIPAGFYRWDLFLARGLDYYTGPIFESVLPDHPHIGSLTGGGRFDRLVGTFLGSDIPAVGTTIGLDRIFTALEQLQMLPPAKTTVQVLVCRFGDAETAHNIKTTQYLRGEGFSVELYPESDKLKKQFGYADKKGIPVVIVQGPDEIVQDVVTIKMLQSGDQQKVESGRLKEKILEILQRTASV